MSQTMIERIAKAMDPECFDPEVERVYGDLWAFEKQAKMKQLARAALLAMREPTDHMVHAGLHHVGNMAGRWRAMVDAALKEPAP